MFALAQIGPAVEKTFGRARMLFLFMATGILANVGSGLVGLDGVAAGASGALMGLIGLAAGWGHRDGTTIGKGVRNRMLKWAGYTMVFGFFIHGDNAAHAAGFAAGALLGYAIPLARKRTTSFGVIDVVVGTLGAASALACAYLSAFPPAFAKDWPAIWRAQDAKAAAANVADATAWMDAMREACPLLESGQKAAARDRLRHTIGPVIDQLEDAGTDSVAAYCAYYQNVRRVCDARRRGGSVPGSDKMDPDDVASLEQSWDEVCAHVEALRTDADAADMLDGGASDDAETTGEEAGGDARSR